MAKTRIYLVKDSVNNDNPRLIEATSAAVAIRHCAKRYTAIVPSTKDVVDLMEQGASVEVVADAVNLELELK